MTPQPASATVGFASSLYKPQTTANQIDADVAETAYIDLWQSLSDQVILVRHAMAITSPAAQLRNTTSLVALLRLLRAFSK